MAKPWGDLERWLRDHGQVITVVQAAALGLTRAQRERLVRDGHLVRPRRGVLVGASAVPSPQLDIRVAVAAAGDGAAASHLSAALVLGLIARTPGPPHVTIPRRRNSRLPGVVVHRSRALTEITTEPGFRTTTASRTLVEIAGLPEIGQRALLDAVDIAIREHMTAIPKLVRVAEAHRRARHAGPTRLLALLRRHGYLDGPTPSALERLLTDLLDDLHRDHGVPVPVREHPVDGGRYRLDRAWPELRLAVEVDGYAWHGMPEHLGRDHHRRNALSGRWRVLGYTWRQLVDERDRVAAGILEAYREAEVRTSVGGPGWPR